MTAPWKAYQDETAAFFRSLGLSTTPDETLKGVRTTHDIDVVVRSHQAGFDVLWLIECKHWQTRVSKLHVLALREIVSDIGADKGILLAENGFQSGALEAAALTNVIVTSLTDVRTTASAAFYAMRLRDLSERIEICKSRYWGIPKDARISTGLRPEVGDIGYSGGKAIEVVETLLLQALRGVYPVEIDPLFLLSFPELPKHLVSAGHIVFCIEPLVAGLESRLKDATDGDA